VRLFVAVALPEPISAALRGLIQALRGELPGLRWVRPEGIHLTLKFLGEVAETGVPGLEAELSAGLRGALAPFAASVAGLGLFPEGPGRRARVVWVGVTAPGGSLAALRELVERACVRAGYPPERRPFSPHLTLARVGDEGPPPGLAQAVWSGRQLDLGELAVDRVTLFQSMLSPQGASYRNLREFPL